MMRHPLVLILGTLISVARMTETHLPEYKLEEFAKSPGIYYEKLGKAVLYSTTWKTVIYLPLNAVTNQMDTISSYVEYVNRLCLRIDLRSWTACHHLDELTLTKLRQVRESERLIASMAGRRDMESRKKRGLFDFVGKVSKVLFGTMDEDDAQYYNDQIEHFERSSDSLTHLLKQQLTIVRSTLGAINETLLDVTYNEDKMRAGLIQLRDYVDSVVTQYGNVTNLLSVKITLESHIARVLDGLHVLQRYLDALLASLVDAQQGILHPQIISPQRVINALRHDSSYFPPETFPPFPLSKDSAYLLYKVCGVHVYLYDEILSYVLELPLVNKGNYDVLRMIPVPVALGGGRFVYVDTGSDLLFFERARQYYFLSTERELSLCKALSKNAFVCAQRHPLLFSHFVDSCVIKMLQPRSSIPNECDTRVVHLIHTLWTPLQNNSWIYFAPTTDTITVLCKSGPPIDVSIMRVGKLSIRSGCKGYSASAILQATDTGLGNATLEGGDLLSQVPLQHECCEELGVTLNLSALTLEVSHQNIISHLTDLRYASKKVSELEIELEEQNKMNNHSIQHHMSSITVYVIVSAVCIYMMYKLLICIKKYCNFSLCTKGERYLRDAIVVSPDSGGAGNTVNIHIQSSNESLAALPCDNPLDDTSQASQEGVKRVLRPRTFKSYY